MKFIKKLHENRKAQFAIVAGIAALLFIFGWKMEAGNLATELPLETNAISEIQNEANSVKLARNNYFSAVGKGNSGAYDEYQNALICEENLDLRTEEMKNLRAEYQRLISEIGLRERELRAAEIVVKFEEKAAQKVAEIIPDKEVAELQKRETTARTKFEKAGSDLKSCIETFQNLEKCETVTQAFLKEKNAYLGEVYAIESIIEEGKAEAKKQLEKMQKEAEEEWYQSEQKNKYERISEFLNKIKAKNLEASLPGPFYFAVEDNSIDTGDSVRWKYFASGTDHYEFSWRLEGSDTFSGWSKFPAGDCSNYSSVCSSVQNTPGVFEAQARACGDPGLGGDCTTATQQKWSVGSAAYPTGRVFELQDSSVNVGEDIYFKYSASGANHYKFMHRLSGGNWPSIWTSLYSAPCSYSDAWCKTQLTTPGTYEFKLAACGDSSTNYCLSKTQSIVVNTPIDGTCGTANLGTFSSAADVNTAVLCATGTLNPTTIIGSGPWSWSCDGVNGGNNDSCSASLSSTPIDGTCGAANLGTFSSTTDVNTAGLCVAGTPNPTAVTNSGPWIWSCDGINGSNNSSACSADLSIPFGTPGIIFSMYFNGYEWQITPDTKTTGKFVLKLKSGTISYEIQNMELYNGKAKIGTITYDPAKKGYGFITIDPNVMKAAGFVGKLNSTNMIGFAIEGTELDPVIFNTAVKSKSTNAEQAQVIYDFKNSTGLTWVEIASLTGDKIEAADIEAFVTTNLAVINGTCGTANTGTFNSASEVNTAGLCATGNPDPATVTDPGLWIWVCKGVNSGSDSPACGANPIADCGNGSLDTGEQCDDGNIIAGDSCSATCQNEIVPGTTGGSSGSSGSTIGKIAIGAIGALGIAGALGALGSTGDGISSSIGKIATGAIDGVFGGLTGLATGAKTVVKSVMGGISDVTKALGLGDPFASAGTASGTVFDGPGAIIGLQQVFKPNYAGNTYGSAIGIITGWTNFLLPFVGAIAIAAIVYAGFLYLTAAGNDEQAGKAKKIIIWVVIGIIVIFSAYAIVNTLLGSSSGGGDNGTSISVGGLSVEF